MSRFRKLVLASTVFTLSAFALVERPMAADTPTPPKKGFTRSRGGPGFFGAPLITIALNHKSELNLTADQVTNLENIRSHYQSQVTPAQQQLASIEKEIATLTQQTPANLVEIKNKLQEAEKYRTDLRYLRIEALENGRSVLTEQQREQLKTLVRSTHGRFRRQQSQPQQSQPS